MAPTRTVPVENCFSRFFDRPRDRAQFADCQYAVRRFGRVFATNERVLAALVPAQPTAVENALELYRRTRAQATHAAVIFMGLRRRARCVVAMLPRDVAALLARALWAQRVAPDVWQPAGPSVRRSKRIKLKQARAVAKCE